MADAERDLQGRAVGALPQPLRERAAQLRKAGAWAELASWVQSLPSLTVTQTPSLRLLRAEAALRLGQPHDAVEDANAVLDEFGGLSPQLRAEALLIRSNAAIVRGFPDRALEDASTAAAIAEHEGVPADVQVDAHRRIGTALGILGEIDRAIEHFERALRLCARSSDLGLQANIHHALGVALARLGQWSEAQVHFNEARAAYEKLGNPVELSEVLTNLGRLYYDQGEYDIALSMTRRALACAREAGYHRTAAMAQINIGEILQQIGAHREALEAYRAALKPADEALEPRLACCADTGIGVTYRSLGDRPKARLYLKQALYAAKRLGLRHELAMAMLQQGILACDEAQHDAAKESITAAVAGLTEVGAQAQLVQAQLYLALVYLRIKQWRHVNATLRGLAKMVNELDLKTQLARHASAVPDVVDYAASKRIGGDLFTDLRVQLRGAAGPVAEASSEPQPPIIAAARLPRVEVYTLGRFEVWVDRRKVEGNEWQSQKPKELLLYLLCNPEGGAREQLLEVLWPEVSISLSRNAFYNNVYRTRRALYDACVVQVDGSYRLNPEGTFWFDLSEFRRYAHEDDRPLRGGNGSVTGLTRAVELYRGPFAPEFYADWVDTIRVETEAQYMRALGRLATWHTSHNELDEAVRYLERLLREDPTHTAAHEQIIRLLFRLGNIAEARRRYRHYAAVMKREAGGAAKSFEQLQRELR